MEPLGKFFSKNPDSEYVKDMCTKFETDRPAIDTLIKKLGKFDKKFIEKESLTAHNEYILECEQYFVNPEVFIEKIGNANKGVMIGTFMGYGNLVENRKKTFSDKNVFNMWVNGKIEGSVLVTSSHMGPENILTGELFMGCNTDKKFI